MKFLVLGATGTVGSQVARELAARGHQVRVLTRTPDKARDRGAGRLDETYGVQDPPAPPPGPRQ